MIYFIQVGDDGPVKIGLADDPYRRLVALQCASPFELRLLGGFEGGRGEELKLHKMFAHARIRGEWFEPTEELLAFVLEHDLDEVRAAVLQAWMQNWDPLAKVREQNL